MSARERRRATSPRVRVRRTRLGELQLASTSDIAFLLLIFFLATAVFAAHSGLAFVLPPAAGGTVAPAEETLIVAVDAGGAIAVEGRSLDPAALTAWAQERERERPGRRYVVEVDGRCRYERLVAALDALRAAAVRELSFRAVEPQ